MELTERQIKILKAIITEFLDSALPVGSLALYNKYEIGVSPATLRSEMCNLATEGYLFKEHSSSGRVPTTLGIRYFIDKILREEDIGNTTETVLRENLFQKRFDKARFIQEAVRSLSELSGLAALSLTDNMLYSAGVGNLLTEPEFQDLSLLQNVLEVIENESFLEGVFEKYMKNFSLRILVGDEIGISSLASCSIIYSPFHYFRGEKGYLAVIGSRRMGYKRAIPAVRIVSNFVEEAINGWE